MELEDIIKKALGEVMLDLKPYFKPPEETDTGSSREPETPIIEGWGFRMGKVRMAVYNPLSVVGPQGSQDPSTLLGMRLSRVKFDKQSKLLTIVFNSDTELRIDLSDEKYTGPEALILWLPGDREFVF